jgi:hypothetical protein
MTLDSFGDRASTLSANSLLTEPVFSLLVPQHAGANRGFVLGTAVVANAGTVTNAELTDTIDTGIYYYKKIDPVDNYLGRNCIFCLNLELNEASDQRLISGYSSIGKNAVIRFDGSQLLTAANVDLTMFVLVKRCLKVRAGQQIFLEM